MKLVVGLGNPGPKYETTRHNVGFLAVDHLIDAWKAEGPETSNQGEIYKTTVAGERVLILKPQTYMNNSGRCVGPIFHFFKCEAEDVIVIHDDLDLKPMAIRIKTGGGAGGHNGIRSIDSAVGGENIGYHRVRVGIGRPEAGSPISAVDFVLQPFADDELDKLADLFVKVESATKLLIQGDSLRAMNMFNGNEAKG